MSSQIDITKINSDYPIAGKINSSQGFRDNFANIKIALTTASQEITTLQVNSPKLNDVNDFGYTGIMRRMVVQESGYTALNNAEINGNIDFSLGNYHKTAITTNTTFTVVNWPDDGVFSTIRIEVAPTVSHNVQINFAAGGSLKKESTLSLPYVSASTNSTVWDLWSSDGGTTVFLKFIGGPFS